MSTLLSSLSAAQIKRAVAIKEQIENLESQLDGLLDEVSETTPAAPGPTPKKRVMSAAAKARIGAAQKAIWAAKKRAQVAKTVTQPTVASKVVHGADTRAQAAASPRKRGTKPAQGAVAGVATPKPKRRLSAAGRAKIIAATKARWARYNAAKKA